jgi:hypothetical protein
MAAPEVIFRIAGEVHEVPPEILGDTRVSAFEAFLTADGEMSAAEARRFTQALLSAVLGEIGTRYVKGMEAHLNAIADLRSELRARYAEVLRRAEGGPIKALPPELEPEAFRDLFNQLVDHMEAITGPREFIDAMQRAIPLDDLQAMEEAMAKEPPPGPPTDLKLGRTGDSVFDPARTDAENAAALDALRELQNQGEDGMARLRAVRAAEQFRTRFLGRDYKVSVRLTQRTAPGRAQAHGLRSFDVDLAGSGYEMVIERNGVEVSPDGLELLGDRFRFLEWKEPMGPQSESYYNTEAGRAALEADMIRRARMASQIPGCDGWYYEAELGVEKPWLNAVFAETIERIGADPATRALAQYLHGPLAAR